MENASSKKSFFRDKAVKHSLNLSEGTVLEWNRSHRFALIVIVVTLILLVSYFFFVSHRLSAKAFGEITTSGSQFIVYAPSTGVIDLSLSEGETIEASQKLFKVARRDMSNGEYIDDKISAEQQRQKNILERTASLLESELSNLKLLKQNTTKSIDATIKTDRKILKKQETYLELLQKDMKNIVALNKKGFAGYKEISDIKKSVLTKEVEVAKARKSLSKLLDAKTQINLDFEAQELGVLGKLLDTRLTLSELNERISLSKKTTDQWVTSGISGRVSVIFVSDAQYVSNGDPVLKLISGDAPFMVKAFLDSRSMEGVRIGKEVIIKFHSFPSLKHGIYYGKVSKISEDVIPDSELPSHLKYKKNHYKIHIDINHESLKKIREELRNGMTADIEILGKRRTMFEWVMQRLIRGNTNG